MAGGIHLLPRGIGSAELARLIDLEHVGEDRMVTGIAGADKAGPGLLTFGRPGYGDRGAAIWIGPADANPGTVLVSANPRLDFIRALHVLRASGNWPEIAPATVHPAARVHPSAVVEEGAQIGADCSIGPNAVIAAGASLRDGVVVGAGTVIGHPGFGYARLADGRPLHFPHLGRIHLASGVVIGNLCSLSRGTLDDTIIGANVKMDDGVYIAHNVSIGANTLIMSGVRLNGRVQIGNSCWLGTGAMVREGVTVGNRATVGMGAVVVKPVPDDVVQAGNPARILE